MRDQAVYREQCVDEGIAIQQELEVSEEVLPHNQEDGLEQEALSQNQEDEQQDAIQAPLRDLPVEQARLVTGGGAAAAADENSHSSASDAENQP
jgi:hypothetical protein